MASSVFIGETRSSRAQKARKCSRAGPKTVCCKSQTKQIPGRQSRIGFRTKSKKVRADSHKTHRHIRLVGVRSTQRKVRIVHDTVAPHHAFSLGEPLLRRQVQDNSQVQLSLTGIKQVYTHTNHVAHLR